MTIVAGFSSSRHSSAPVELAAQIARTTGESVVAASVIERRLPANADPIEDEYVEYAAVSGLTTMVYNPIGGGLLTGRHQFGEAPTEGRFGDSRLAEMYRERYWNTQIFEAIAAGMT